MTETSKLKAKLLKERVEAKKALESTKKKADERVKIAKQKTTARVEHKLTPHKGWIRAVVEFLIALDKKYRARKQ